MSGAGAREQERAERLQLLANQVTLARLLLVAALAVAAAGAGGIGASAAALVIAIWLTDIVDGPLARLGRPPGVRSRPEGQALDPVVDDFAYAIGFAVLFGAGLIPLAFLALVIATRCIFTLVRIAGLAMGMPFPRPRISGKAMGISLGCGQIALFAAAAGLLGGAEPDAFKAPLVWAMAGACLVGLVDFLQANRGVIAAAFLQPSARAGTRAGQASREPANSVAAAGDPVAISSGNGAPVSGTRSRSVATAESTASKLSSISAR